MENHQANSVTSLASTDRGFHPKATHITWNYTEDPGGYLSWKNQFMAIVAASGLSGVLLNAFIRSQTGEKAYKAPTTSKILTSSGKFFKQNSDASPDDTKSITNETSPPLARHTTPPSRITISDAPTAPQYWDDLTDDAKQLDRVIFLTLLTVVKGPALDLIRTGVGVHHLYTASRRLEERSLR